MPVMFLDYEYRLEEHTGSKKYSLKTILIYHIHNVCRYEHIAHFQGNFIKSLNVCRATIFCKFCCEDEGIFDEDLRVWLAISGK